MISSSEGGRGGAGAEQATESDPAAPPSPPVVADPGLGAQGGDGADQGVISERRADAWRSWALAERPKYESSLTKFGDSPEGMDWCTAEGARERFGVF